jgi:hypothetical protein
LREDLTGKNTAPKRLEDIARDYIDEEQIKLLREAIKDEEANRKRRAPSAERRLTLSGREKA